MLRQRGWGPWATLRVDTTKQPWALTSAAQGRVTCSPAQVGAGRRTGLSQQALATLSPLGPCTQDSAAMALVTTCTPLL